MTISDAYAAMMRKPLLLTIEAAGIHRFNYAKLEPETGETVWRWPTARPLSDGSISAVGHLLDVSA